MDAPTNNVEMAMPAKNAEPAVEQPVRLISCLSRRTPIFRPWSLGETFFPS